MVVHPNSFDKLRMEIIKLDNINKQQSEQIEKMKCCENCEHWHWSNGDSWCDIPFNCKDYDGWELTE